MRGGIGLVITIIKKYPIIRELFLYGIIGGISATLDSLFFAFLDNLKINIYIANLISINIGITVSFFLNTYFNFKLKNNLIKRAISFFSVGYIGMLLSMLILYIGTNLINIKAIFVKLFSVIIVAMFQFILNKIITYREVK